MNRLFSLIALLCGIVAPCLGQDHLFVYSNRPEVPTKLTRKDFLVASTNMRNLEAQFDKRRVFRGDRYEGDIKGLNSNTVRDFVSEANRQSDTPSGNQVFVQHSAVRNRYNLWPSKQIPYSISSQYSSRSRSLLAKAIQDFQSKTCLKFIPRTNQRDYIYIRPDDGCYSHVGRTGGQQTLSLDGGCMQHGTIIHEMMHSTGFFHEQNRNDRDNYVQVIYQNIEPGLQSNFERHSLAVIDHLGTSYDYGSVMHYGSDYFSRNGRPTIVPKQPGVRIGQRRGFSDVDIQRLNKLYGCANAPVGKTGTGNFGGTSPSVVPPDDDACYEKVPNSRYLLRIERMCYRVLKYRSNFIVTYCTAAGRSDFAMTSDIEYARSKVKTAKALVNRRCRGPGNVPASRRQPNPPPPTGGSSGFGDRFGSWMSRFLGGLRFSPQGDTPDGRNVHADIPEGSGGLEGLEEIDL